MKSHGYIQPAHHTGMALLARHAGENPASVAHERRTSRPRKRVLVADDDEMVRLALIDVLESEGYEVDQARNGRETVDRVVDDAPDLVLLDLNMPCLDGWAAFAQLDHLSPLLPVVVITARPNQYGEAVRLGVDAFMEKPLNIPVLLEAIQKLLDESPGRRVERVTDRHFATMLLESGNRGGGYPEWF
jgi:two-component system, response regulator, stage 0 sporulation protein F